MHFPVLRIFAVLLHVVPSRFFIHLLVYGGVAIGINFSGFLFFKIFEVAVLVKRQFRVYIILKIESGLMLTFISI